MGIRNRFIEREGSSYIFFLKRFINEVISKESLTINNQHISHYSCNFKTPYEMNNQSNIKIKTYRRQL